MHRNWVFFAHLQIRYFMMLKEDVPSQFVMLYEMLGSLRSDVIQVRPLGGVGAGAFGHLGLARGAELRRGVYPCAQVEAIVSLYNGIHVTLQDEEWPLIQSAVDALDEVRDTLQSARLGHTRGSIFRLLLAGDAQLAQCMLHA